MFCQHIVASTVLLIEDVIRVIQLSDKQDKSLNNALVGAVWQKCEELQNHPLSNRRCAIGVVNTILTLVKDSKGEKKRGR